MDQKRKMHMNRKSPAHRRPGRRAAVAAGLVLAVGLAVSTQLSAQASVHVPAKSSTAALQSVSGTSGQVVTRRRRRHRARSRGAIR